MFPDCETEEYCKPVFWIFYYSNLIIVWENIVTTLNTEVTEMINILDVPVYILCTNNVQSSFLFTILHTAKPHAWFTPCIVQKYNNNNDSSYPILWIGTNWGRPPIISLHDPYYYYFTSNFYGYLILLSSRPNK